MTTKNISIETIGDRIKIIRGGESRESLAPRIGVSRNTIVNYETGKSDPVSTFLIKILDVHPNINPTWLLTGKGPMEKGGEIQKTVSSAQVDHSFLEAVIAAVEEHLDVINGHLPPAKKAQLISIIYDLSDKKDKKVDQAVVINLFKLAV